MERLSVGLEVKFAKDAPAGTFEGYGAVFGNVDSYGDVIQPNAFTDTLKEWAGKGKLPKMLLQHGGMFGPADDMVPIGKWTSMDEDQKGLRVQGKLFMAHERGQRIYEAVREGELDGLSIGYRVAAGGAVYGRNDDEPRRTLTNVKLLEVSLVTFGANDQALVDGVKSDAIDRINTLAAAEEFLREVGKGLFSRKTATEFISVVKRIAQREAGATKSLGGLLEQIRSVRQLTTPSS